MLFRKPLPIYLVVASGQEVIELLRLPLHQNDHRLFDQAPDADGDQDGDEDGADRIGDHPIERPHQDGGHDDPHAAQGVGQDV